MIRIALVDDEAQHRAALEKHLAAYFRGREEPFQCVPFSDALDLLSNYDFSYDIIFLDIDMKLSNGMEAAKRLRKIDGQVALIFETQLAQYAVEGLAEPINHINLANPLPSAFSRRLSSQRSKPS